MLAIFLLAFCYNNIQASTPRDSILQKKMEQTWRDFRSIYPSCFQTIALRHYGKDTCVFVMSEPPNWVTQDSIKKLFNSYGGHIGIAKQKIGYDGVLSDAIGCVALDQLTFPMFQSKLFKLFYGTDYKPYYTNLDQPIPHIYSMPESLNYSPNENSLTYIEDTPIFSIIKHNGSKCVEVPVSIVDILKTNYLPSVIYYSKTPGYVVWIIDPAIVKIADSDIAAIADSIFKVDARKFLLDTDLIIDAIPSQRGVALVGRERKASVDVLPPLRAETIQLLAQQTTDTLCASFIAESSIYVEDSLYYTPIQMNELLKHSEFGILMGLSAGGLISNANSQVFDYFASPTQLDIVRLDQYAYIFEAFKLQRSPTSISRDIAPRLPQVWIEAPTTIVTNIPLMQ